MKNLNKSKKILLIVLLINLILICSCMHVVKAEDEGIEPHNEGEIINNEENPEEGQNEGENGQEGLLGGEAGENGEVVDQEPKNSIERIDVTAFLNKDGSANMTEVWKANMVTGSEITRIYTDFSSYKISNLSVEDKTTGRKYTYVENWNNVEGKENRDDKCGIVDLESIVNICWGIGEYGSHEYIVRYTISNFVQDYSNYQLVYLKIFQDNMDPIPRKSKTNGIFRF